MKVMLNAEASGGRKFAPATPITLGLKPEEEKEEEEEEEEEEDEEEEDEEEEDEEEEDEEGSTVCIVYSM